MSAATTEIRVVVTRGDTLPLGIQVQADCVGDSGEIVQLGPGHSGHNVCACPAITDLAQFNAPYVPPTREMAPPDKCLNTGRVLVDAISTAGGVYDKTRELVAQEPRRAVASVYKRTRGRTQPEPDRLPDVMLEPFLENEVLYQIAVVDTRGQRTVYEDPARLLFAVNVANRAPRASWPRTWKEIEFVFRTGVSERRPPQVPQAVRAGWLARVAENARRTGQAIANTFVLTANTGIALGSMAHTAHIALFKADFLATPLLAKVSAAVAVPLGLTSRLTTGVFSAVEPLLLETTAKVGAAVGLVHSYVTLSVTMAFASWAIYKTMTSAGSQPGRTRGDALIDTVFLVLLMTLVASTLIVWTGGGFGAQTVALINQFMSASRFAGTVTALGDSSFLACMAFEFLAFIMKFENSESSTVRSVINMFQRGGTTALTLFAGGYSISDFIACCMSAVQGICIMAKMSPAMMKTVLAQVASKLREALISAGTTRVERIHAGPPSNVGSESRLQRLVQIAEQHMDSLSRSSDKAAVKAAQDILNSSPAMRRVLRGSEQSSVENLEEILKSHGLLEAAQAETYSMVHLNQRVSTVNAFVTLNYVYNKLHLENYRKRFNVERREQSPPPSPRRRRRLEMPTYGTQLAHERATQRSRSSSA